MKLKRIATAALLGLVLLLCACGAPAAAALPPVQAVPPAPAALPQDDALAYRFLCTLPGMDTQTMTELARGVQDRCDTLGIEVWMHNTHGDAAAQTAEMDAFVAGGGQAILALPADNTTVLPVLTQLLQQGVFVVPLFVDMNASPPTADAASWADTAMMPDSYAAGRLLGANAAAFAQNQPGAAAVLLLEGARTPFAAGVEEGYAALMPEMPLSTHIVPETADLLVESLLAENPDIRVFLAGSDRAALAAREGVLRVLAVQAQPQESEQTLEQAAAAPDLSAYYFGGAGAMPEGFAALADGRLSATVAPGGYEMGVLAVDAAVALMQGTTPESRVPQPWLIDKTTAAEYNN